MKKLLFAFLTISAGCGPSAVCDYQLPPGYHLAQSGAGKYAICRADKFFGISYLDRDNSFFGEQRFYWWPQSHRNIDIFDDSCQAKGAAKAFFDFQDTRSFKILGTEAPKPDTPTYWVDPYEIERLKDSSALIFEIYVDSLERKYVPILKREATKPRDPNKPKS